MTLEGVMAEKQKERLVLEIHPDKHYTYTDYKSWPDWFRCELIDGQVYPYEAGGPLEHIIRVYEKVQ